MPSPESSFSLARNTRLVTAPAGGAPATSSPIGDVPPDADAPLGLRFLLDIAEGLATVTDLWSPFLHEDLAERPATRLLATERWEAWLLEWDAGQSVELHDHGPSAGAFTVVGGSLVEIRADRPGQVTRAEVTPGRSRSFRTGTLHDVLNLGTGPAASIHVYSPPLHTMTFFDPITFEAVRTEPVESPRPALEGDPAPYLHPARSL